MANHTLIASINPIAAPDHIGQEYYNSVTGVWYKAAGVSSIADWKNTTPLVETLTFSTESSKEFLMDLSDATNLRIESIGNGINMTTNTEQALLQFYVSGAWVTTGYGNIQHYASSTPAHGFDSFTLSGMSLSTYFDDAMVTADISLGVAKVRGIIKSFYLYTSTESIAEMASYLAVAAKPTKCRIQSTAGNLTGSFKLTKNP